MTLAIHTIREDSHVRDEVAAGFQDMVGFGLVEALLGRRSRRFFRGAEIPDGVFAHKSKHDAVPLSELEKLVLVAACGGNTSWHHMIYRGRIYAPHLSNYAGAAGGRPSPRLPASIRAIRFSRKTRVSMYSMDATRRLVRIDTKTVRWIWMRWSMRSRAASANSRMDAYAYLLKCRTRKLTIPGWSIIPAH